MRAPVLVRLMGPVLVVSPEEELREVLPQKCRALLCILGSAPGTVVSREKITGLLWPETDGRRARGNLRQCLRTLRLAVGQEAVESVFDSLRLVPDLVQTDVSLLRACAKGTSAADLVTAAEAVQGEFGADVTVAEAPFANWLATERAHLQALASDVVRRAIDHCLAADEVNRANRLATGFLRIEPLDEALHRAAIRSYLAQGRKSAAIEQYRQLRMTLWDELGVKPDEETERLVASAFGSTAVLERHSEAEWPGTGPEDIFAGEAPAIAILSVSIPDNSDESCFARGLAEELIVSLSGWRTFPVISAASSLRDPPEADPTKTGRQLGARYVLCCSLRQERSRLRVTARLLETESGRHVWANSFDAALRNILDAQEDMARQIAAVVRDRAERTELERIVWKRTCDLDAWEYVLLGHNHLRSSPRGGYSDAITHFQTALEVDPTYVDALVGLATSYCWVAKYNSPTNRRESLDIAEEYVRRAIEIDWNSAAAHARLGAVHVWKEDFDLGLQETELAVQLNPSDAHSRLALGNRLDLIGRTEDGIAQMETGLRLSPRDPLSADYMGFLARAHLVQGRIDTALALARRAVMLHPNSPDALYRLAACAASADEPDAARVALAGSERLLPGFLAAKAEWAPYSDRARNERFFDGLRRHGL